MLPWENHDPGLDTSRHIVPGSWNLLMEELTARPPALVIDTAVGNHRYYAKYPISGFPRLAAYLAAHYIPLVTILDERGRPYYDVHGHRGG